MTRQKPLCIDLFCGLGGWTEGFLAEGYEVVGFDVERHVYGEQRYPAQLVIQDVLTLHGSQFKDAAVIVASPPCQKYSWLAMPWSRSTDPNNSKAAKALRREWETNGPDNRLFDACFRIQREAIEAAGRFIPLLVENVKGAQPWVGRAAWSYGNFYLWGDIPALMPRPTKTVGDGVKQRGSGAKWFDTGIAALPSGSRGSKHVSHKRDDRGNVADGDMDSVLVHANHAAGAQKTGGVLSRDSFGWSKSTPLRDCNSRSPRRKAASAQIAKIPFDLSSHIARCFSRPSPS